MSKMEYMPVDCLQVPKVLFQMEKYKNLSNTAKILYSLFLDRLKFAVQNGWVDHNGNLFVIYPKSEIKKDLNTTRYGVDQAVQELVQVGKLMRIIPNNGKANHFYINGIYENEMEEESMMTLDTIMANMPLAEREIIMDKMVKASRDIFETIADMGYIDQYETSLTAMEKRGYQDELGEMDIDQIQADGYEFGIDEKVGTMYLYPIISKDFRRVCKETGVKEGCFFNTFSDLSSMASFFEIGSKIYHSNSMDTFGYTEQLEKMYRNKSTENEKTIFWFGIELVNGNDVEKKLMSFEYACNWNSLSGYVCALVAEWCLNDEISKGKAYNLDEIEGIQKFIESLPGEIKQNIVKL